MAADTRARPSKLLWKLLGINVPILAVMILLVWLSIDMLAADYFSELMQRYQIDPEETHGMFLDAVHRYLIWTAAAGLVLAVLLSYVLTRRVLAPLRDMATMTGEVAAGNFDARVPVRGRDELAQLARSFNDMTDSLNHIESLRKKLVADVAHELRTPLTNVRGYLEALSDGVLPPDKATFDMLQQEASRLLALADDLLELARADAAKAHLRLETIDLPDLIRGALAMNAMHFQQRRISVEERFAADARCIEADREKLLQAVGNLVENGWQHARPGSVFTVETHRGNDELRVCFSNDVSSLPEASLPSLFERFYRAEPSRSRAFGGAGIGLAVVKELIEAHGGRVDAMFSDGRLHIRIELPASRR
jgi:signal transduction histidine kinase